MKRCSVENCPRKHHARGFCGKHYRQAKTAGDFSNKDIYTGDYQLLPHELKYYPNGYADKHRPKWHVIVYGLGE